MAFKAAQLINSTREGLEVKGRRKLETAGAFEALLEELQKKTTSTNGQVVVIADLDVSQNKLAYEQYEALFAQLGAASIRVLRFRMFGMATLNDDVMRLIGDYFRLLTVETAPTEMHLSDCAITSEGWAAFMSAIEESELYPTKTPNGMRGQALYLRVENNYIMEAAIQEKVDAGVVKPFTKNGQRSNDMNTKVDLVTMSLGKYQQKQGLPPAPEDAPAPKKVYDKYAEAQQGWNNSWNQWPVAAAAWGAAQGGGWSAGGQGGWQKSAGAQGGWQKNAGAQGGCTPQAARPQGQVRPAGPVGQVRTAGQAWQGAAARPQQQQRPVLQRPPGTQGAQPIKPLFGAASGGARPGVVRPAGIVPAGSLGKTVAGGNAWNRGAAGAAGAQDRSRTPAGKGNVAANGKGGAAGKKNDLPYPWEEHWSDEYQIPYFWNSETGDSLWEKPKA